MRLIDANKCPDCKDCIIRAYCDYTERFGGECIVELILKNQPTAYDVEKVIEDLIGMSNEIPAKGWTKILDIVQRGELDSR